MASKTGLEPIPLTFRGPHERQQLKHELEDLGVREHQHDDRIEAGEAGFEKARRIAGGDGALSLADVRAWRAAGASGVRVNAAAATKEIARQEADLSIYQRGMGHEFYGVGAVMVDAEYTDPTRGGRRVREGVLSGTYIDQATLPELVIGNLRLAEEQIRRVLGPDLGHIKVIYALHSHMDHLNLHETAFIYNLIKADGGDPIIMVNRTGKHQLAPFAPGPAAKMPAHLQVPRDSVISINGWDGEGTATPNLVDYRNQPDDAAGDNAGEEGQWYYPPGTNLRVRYSASTHPRVALHHKWGIPWAPGKDTHDRDHVVPPIVQKAGETTTALWQFLHPETGDVVHEFYYEDAPTTGGEGMPVDEGGPRVGFTCFGSSGTMPAFALRETLERLDPDSVMPEHIQWFMPLPFINLSFLPLPGGIGGYMDKLENSLPEAGPMDIVRGPGAGEEGISHFRPASPLRPFAKTDEDGQPIGSAFTIDPQVSRTARDRSILPIASTRLQRWDMVGDAELDRYVDEVLAAAEPLRDALGYVSTEALRVALAERNLAHYEPRFAQLVKSYFPDWDVDPTRLDVAVPHSFLGIALRRAAAEIRAESERREVFWLDPNGKVYRKRMPDAARRLSHSNTRWYEISSEDLRNHFDHGDAVEVFSAEASPRAVLFANAATYRAQGERPSPITVDIDISAAAGLELAREPQPDVYTLNLRRDRRTPLQGQITLTVRGPNLDPEGITLSVDLSGLRTLEGAARRITHALRLAAGEVFYIRSTAVKDGGEQISLRPKAL